MHALSENDIIERKINGITFDVGRVTVYAHYTKKVQKTAYCDTF